MNHLLRALNRYGLGARIGEQQKIGDPRGWLKDQLKSESARLERPGLLTLEQISSTLQQPRNPRQDRDQDSKRQIRRQMRQILEQELLAVLERRLTSQAPFLERLVAFWSNHLCVSIRAKPLLAGVAGHYERSVIRPHVLGRFEDMVLASAKHPAMLVYLDNARSIGPASRASKLADRRGVDRGLNENYARELLELHTLGVNGGYLQQDVEQLARILTGWTVSGLGPGMRRNSRVRFEFNSMLHEPGSKRLLGKRYVETGISEGERAIRDLCRKDATARFLAAKLVRHFVADEPPATSVEKIARVFATSGGDLRQVSLALIDLEAAWDPAQRKFRTPQDWLVAGLRALGVSQVHPRLAQVLQALRQPLWAPPSPKGYNDTLLEWADPDSLMNRAELAQTIADRIASAGAGPPSRLIETMELEEGDPLREQLVDSTLEIDKRAALALAGPAFQWR